MCAIRERARVHVRMWSKGCRFVCPVPHGVRIWVWGFVCVYCLTPPGPLPGKEGYNFTG